MSAVDNGRNSLAGLSLDAILGGAIPPHQQDHRDDEMHKDKKSWKLFREKFRLKRAGAAWTSSVHTPTSDVSMPNNRSLNRRSSFNRSEDSPSSDPPPPASRSAFTRRGSTRFGISSSSDHHNDQEDILMPGEGPPTRSFKPQISRHNSTRFPGSNNNNNEDGDSSPATGRRGQGEAFSDERILSAREAVAAQEASEAEAAAAKEVGDGEEEAEPVRMSLMDLLEETDRAMGLTGSRYAMGDDYEEEEEYYDDEEEEEEEDGGGIEYTCCVCMVRHKGAAFIPCGHTFCRMCSRELWVQRGNCPLCNGFILEILDIF